MNSKIRTDYECLPCSLSEVFDSYLRDGTRRVTPKVTYLCMVDEVLKGGYLKMRRTRERALAPGKVRNKTAEDIAAGRVKWDGIYESMKVQGYDFSQPVEFVVSRESVKRKLYQGHHRVTIANELGISVISVVFTFEESRRSASPHRP